jgi:hypothetical protein
MMLGAEQHESRARAADLSAGDQQVDVVRSGVLAALLQAVRDTLETDLLAAATAIDTLLHPGIQLMNHDSLLDGT